MLPTRATRLCTAKRLARIGLFAALLLPAVSSMAETTVKISGRITGASGKHTVYVALWNADGFLLHPTRSLRLEPGTALVFQFDIAPGRWALSAFEDVNGNGVLDQGMFGPKEPSGFWRAFSGWHKPSFDEVAAQIDRDTTGSDIKLK
jgi:uncharacterized protein (DUF2141 family)